MMERKGKVGTERNGEGVEEVAKKKMGVVVYRMYRGEEIAKEKVKGLEERRRRWERVQKKEKRI